MTDTFERIERGIQAKHELTLLGPAIESLVAFFQAQHRELARKNPGAVQQTANLNIAMNIAENVRDYLKAIVADGDLAHEDLKRVRQIQDMSPEKRRHAELLG